jgi:hypothetical protein
MKSAVVGLQEISRKLREILPGMAQGPLRDDLELMQRQADLAIRYYLSLGPAHEKATGRPVANDVVMQAAQAAVVPISGVGLREKPGTVTGF